MATPSDYNNKKYWKKVPLDEIKTPRVGKICYGASYWSVTEDNCVLFYRGHSPQCNNNEYCAESIRKKIHPTCRLEYIEMAFIDHNCEDYI